MHFSWIVPPLIVLRCLGVCGLAEVVVMVPLTLTHEHLPGVTAIAAGGLKVRA